MRRPQTAGGLATVVPPGEEGRTAREREGGGGGSGRGEGGGRWERGGRGANRRTTTRSAYGHNGRGAKKRGGFGEQNERGSQKQSRPRSCGIEDGSKKGTCRKRRSALWWQRFRVVCRGRARARERERQRAPSGRGGARRKVIVERGGRAGRAAAWGRPSSCVLGGTPALPAAEAGAGRRQRKGKARAATQAQRGRGGEGGDVPGGRRGVLACVQAGPLSWGGGRCAAETQRIGQEQGMEGERGGEAAGAGNAQTAQSFFEGDGRTKGDGSA